MKWKKLDNQRYQLIGCMTEVARLQCDPLGTWYVDLLFFGASKHIGKGDVKFALSEAERIVARHLSTLTIAALVADRSF